MKNPEIFLKHILESIGEIEKYTKKISRDKFFQTTQTQDAVVRRLEIIGEAVKNLPATFRNKYPDIPWKKIAGMRDVLIHEYFGVDLRLVWRIAKKDLPELKNNILKILKELN
ncbi:DUF86 domain-containing protein [Patescibacteria group bacterium]|nr:DUF86 domain-containing protein [Patescibacteria group bacterium]